MDLVGDPQPWGCEWYATAGIDVAAQSVRSIVTPSGHVFVESEYPAEPLVCP